MPAAAALTMAHGQWGAALPRARARLAKSWSTALGGWTWVLPWGVANIKGDTGIDRDIRGYAAFTVYGPKGFRLITVDGGNLALRRIPTIP